MNVPSEFKVRKNLLLHPEPFFWLLEIRAPGDGPLVGPSGASEIPRATANSESVVFGSDPVTGAPLTWKPWRIEIGEIADDTEGNVNSISLKLSGGMGTIMRLFRDNDMLKDHTALLHLVHRAFLNNADAKYTIRASVIDSSAGYEDAAMSLAGFNLMNFDVPQRVVLRTCGHTYRDGDCGFVGDPGNATLGDCDLSFEACEERGVYEEANSLAKQHPKNFGGAKAAPVGAAL